MAYKTS